MVNPINWRELDLAIYGYLYTYIGIGFEVVDGGRARPDVSINRDINRYGGRELADPGPKLRQAVLFVLLLLALPNDDVGNS